jgi:hypothetical protein
VGGDMRSISFFNVIRLNRGPQKGQVWIVPAAQKSGCRMVNGRPHNGPLLRATGLLYTVSWDSAYWYAIGLLQGEGSRSLPLFKAGRSGAWKEVRRRRYRDDEF